LIRENVQSHLDSLMTKKITLGVTGFSRAGKTVFIGSLAQALLTSDSWVVRRGQGPLAQFGAFERGQYRCAQIRDDVNSDLPQFPFRKVRDSLVGKYAKWPEATAGISRLAIDIEYTPNSRFFKSPRRLQLQLVDYPGEWLIDLVMLSQTYAEWSDRMLSLAKKGSRGQWSTKYFNEVEELVDLDIFDEEVTSQLADTWTEYLQVAADNGLVLNQPGRLLRPDALRGSSLLRLVPLPDEFRSSVFGQGMQKRFEEYKKKAIKPFYRDHFSKMDRQIMLVDVLRSLQLGEEVFGEMVEALKETLLSFQYGKNDLLSWVKGAKTTHVLFAATKCDHVVRGDRANLAQMLRRMLALVDDHNQLRASALKQEVIALASVCATEDRRTVKPPVREILYGQPEDKGVPAQYDPGGLPLDMPPNWDEVYFDFLKFLPLPDLAPESLYDGFPAINIGKALDFLIGDDFL
jgi:predicted YcjX-like family ATPase